MLFDFIKNELSVDEIAQGKRVDDITVFVNTAIALVLTGDVEPDGLRAVVTASMVLFRHRVSFLESYMVVGVACKATVDSRSKNLTWVGLTFGTIISELTTVFVKTMRDKVRGVECETKG